MLLRYMLETESLDAWEIAGTVQYTEGFEGGGGDSLFWWLFCNGLSR